MIIQRTPEGFLWSLQGLESDFVLKCLREMLALYQTPPELWTARERDYWSAPLVAESAESSKLREDPEDPVEQREAWRGERGALLQKWIEGIETKGREKMFSILPEEVDALVMILNERRLFLAAIHEVSEETMETELEDIPQMSDRQALLEIHVLGSVLEMWMRTLLSPD